MRIAMKLTCVGMLALLAGCSSLNPFARKTPRNPPAALQEIAPTVAARAAWTASIGSAGRYTFTPAFAGDSVYIAAADGSIARLESGSGRPLWRINAGTALTAGVGTDGSTVAVVADQGVVMAFDADGKQRWTVQASSEVLSAPAVGQGVVVVRSVDNRIAAYEIETGMRRWVAQRTAPPLTLRSAPGIVISDQTAYVALPGGRLSALALNNGAPRWEVAVAEPRGTTELERIADLAGSPVLAGNDVCAVAYQGRLACFDMASGTARWVRETSSEVGVGVDERFVYVADERGAVTAYTRDTGVSAWRNTALANRRLSAPAPVGRTVAVGDFEGHVHFLSR
ncbi:MAG TPA: outer membrane protein assembly factor BamB, partial [Noviherbaspirillum sp.]|nr:outer membrane protein assembly factor BamB [Noviherbaspirillum sp.]